MQLILPLICKFFRKFQRDRVGVSEICQSKLLDLKLTVALPLA